MKSDARTSAPDGKPARNTAWAQALARAQPHATTTPHITPPGWHARQAPLKAALIADMHVGSHSDDLVRFEQIVDQTNAWKPDVVLLLGDFMHSRVFYGKQASPEVIASILGPLDARLGTYAILGNHDWRYGGQAVRHALEARGVMVLENSSHRVSDASGDFFIAGLADAKTRTPEAEKTLNAVPDDVPTLIMAHDPATFADISPGPFLTVCGHTHGGQVCLPFIGPLTNSSAAPLSWTSGHIVDAGRHLYVCRGLGTSLVPFRLNCRPELCLMSIGP